MKLSWTEKILLNKWGDSKNLSWADQRPYEKLECPGCLLKTREYTQYIYYNILYSSNHNVHKNSYGLYFWASDTLIYRF